MLDLSNNKIDSFETIAFLSVNIKLELLHLSNNPI